MSYSTHPDPAAGLPPVTPPSGKFIAQLFVIPGVLVAVAVGCIWFVSWLVGGYLTPEQFLKDLRSPNAEVRWRRASDLAQVLKRDEALAANAKFSLDLAELLRQALRENEQAERQHAQHPAEDRAGALKTLQDERDFIEYLIASLGNFSVPTGTPLLCELALSETGADPASVALHRQLAVWALANLGENVKRYDLLPAERKAAVQASLDAEAAAPSADRSQWAKQALAYLQARDAGKPQAFDVAETLARCAQADDPMLRKFVALALTFWDGTAEENARIDHTLVALSKDDGHGDDRVARSKDDGKGLAVDSAVRGREIRYQAVQALARRGSPQAASRLGVLGEMLDEDLQAKTFHTRLKDGRDVPDGGTVGNVLSGALQGVAELHRKQPGLDLAALVPAVDKLAHSANPKLRTEAERTLAALDRK